MYDHLKPCFNGNTCIYKFYIEVPNREITFTNIGQVICNYCSNKSMKFHAKQQGTIPVCQRIPQHRVEAASQTPVRKEVKMPQYLN